MQEVLYEWIVVCGGKEFVLTENQYNLLLTNQSQRLISFDTFSINPAYISACYRQKVKRLRELYPCGECDGKRLITKEDWSQIVCGKCNGSGVDLGIKPTSIVPVETNSFN